MSEIYSEAYQSISPRYYSHESVRSHYEDETRRVEDIIEEEKKREAAAAEETGRQESQKIIQQQSISEEIKAQENLQQQKKHEEEFLERLRAAASAEIERWLDYERIKMLENIRREKEAGILDDFMRENMLNDMNAPDLSEYEHKEKAGTAASINLLA